MKELTMDEKRGLLAEVNKLLATIPDYQMAMPVIEMENNDIFITDKGYIDRLYLEYGEISDKFLGKTRKEAIQSLAHNWIFMYGEDLFAAKLYWSWEKKLSQIDKFKHFCAYCDSYIYKGIDHSPIIPLITDNTVIEAVNQKAADILSKITAYNVPLVRLMNNNFSSQLVWWYKKEGERWLYCTFEQGEVHTSICAENDDEMVYKTVYDSLAHYAQKEFVVFRERNGKNPYRKYDDFMEECLRIVYPEHRYQRPPEYDDRKYEELDADYLKGSSLSSK
ncbi:hypothetical protein [Segatella bryantii]|uniref:hypothetical protein n=1 Tax=Segatella bryantii TaxID=77095 RepID=UPI0009439565|nr:hypothetical protein [Segatella bryantii]